MQSMKVPGAIVTTIIAAMLYAALQQVEIEFAGAEWLPVVVAAIGYALKYLQVAGVPKDGPPPTRPQPAASAMPPGVGRGKVMRFLLG